MTVQGNRGAVLVVRAALALDRMDDVGMNRTGKNRQSGVVIGPILFVVAILAVLAMAIAAGSGSFTASTSSETAKAKASALIEIGQNLKIGFDRLTGSGIGYWDVVIDASNTTNAEDLFSPSGGGITPPSAKMWKSGEDWQYTMAGITSMGSCPKRVAVLRVDDATICSRLNDALGNGTTPGAENIGNPSDNADCIYIPTGLAQKMAGCYESNTSSHDGFFFYQVLGIDPENSNCAMECPK